MTKITHPELPFFYTVPGGHVSTGQTFKITGEPSHHAHRFSISLIQHASQLCVFRMEFRFDQGTTVQTANVPTGKWGHKERSGLPIQRGRHFKVKIKVQPDRFKIVVDDHHHCDFLYRAPSTLADTLQVKGDINVQFVKFK